jgi:hypothetical protein
MEIRYQYNMDKLLLQGQSHSGLESMLVMLQHCPKIMLHADGKG